MDNKKGNIVIHYNRKKADYKRWSIWLWEFPQRLGKQFEFNGADSYGVVGKFPLSNWSKLVRFNNLGLIIKDRESWKKDGSDKVIKLYKIDEDKNGDYHVYIKQGDDELYANAKFERITTFIYAKFLDWKTVEIKAHDAFSNATIFEDGKVVKKVKFSKGEKEAKIELKNEIDLDHDYKVEIKLIKNNKTPHRRIRFRELYKTEKFQKLYVCNEELGAICTKKETIFKVWSPVSKKITLRLYKNGTPEEINETKGSDEIYLEKEMEKQKNGVFFLKISGNFHGFYYTYVVNNDVYKDREIVDIYAKSAGVNGMRGMVVDFDQIKGEDLSDIKPHPYSPRELTVYETHIADLTSSKTWSDSKKDRALSKTFLGACLEGTTYSENNRTVKTGFDHIKELGVNAVQLLPIADQTNDEVKPEFNWGYNPLNYNCLEGSYSTDPFDGIVRIKEFKYLVKKYHDAGINIIMDVVYNHLYSAIGSSFDVLMPGYYFRYTEEGKLSNGSGCGNETASEMPMFRKFMIDSVLFWAKTYKLGGFRFDLMAVHDLETMNLLCKALHDYDKNIVVYGEPWAGDASMLPGELSAHKGNANKYEGYGFFNDCMRDSLVRTSKDISHAGWCLTNNAEDQDRVMQGIKGTSYDVCDPDKILNYASCHDNRTLYDRIVFDGITNKNEAKHAAMLANSIVLTSNGISFILSGEEFLRSKGGSDNSYNAPYEVNELDYSLKIENYDMFKNYQKLIKFKHSVSDLSLDKEVNTKLRVENFLANVIYYELDDVRSERKYLVFHVNGSKTGRPVRLDLDGYKLYLDTINPYKELSKYTMLVPYETIIVYK